MLAVVTIQFQSLKGFQRFCGPRLRGDRRPHRKFQSLKGFQRFCGKRLVMITFKIEFQSLKGFQRFCGRNLLLICINRVVSIPKRVSEVLWLRGAAAPPDQPHPFQSLKGFQRFCGPICFILSSYGTACFNP